MVMVVGGTEVNPDSPAEQDKIAQLLKQMIFKRGSKMVQKLAEVRNWEIGEAKKGIKDFGVKFEN